MNYWIVVDREHHTDVAVGPFTSYEEASSHWGSLQMDAICEEDATGGNVRILDDVSAYDVHSVVA